MQPDAHPHPGTASSAVLAIDIGGTNLRMALVSREGFILKRLSKPCRIADGIDRFLASLSECVQALTDFATATAVSIRAVGAGVPGAADSSGRVLSSVNLAPLVGFNLREWLAATVHLPAIMLNDANAAAFAELTYGAGRPFDSFIHFTLGTGVGSGLVLDKRVWAGRRGIAAEYGHATVEPDGRVCSCGNQGCLEQYASASGIVLTAMELLSMGRNSSLADRIESITAAQIASAAFAGDSVAVECLEMAGRYLGIAAASAVNLLDLEAVIIGGGVAESFTLLGPYISAELHKRAYPSAREGLLVLKGELGDNAGLLGAAAAAWQLVD
ncbi:MAG: ROK family protein [Geobacter sp.]|nr:ROK family protein [Geobacter sp.]